MDDPLPVYLRNPFESRCARLTHTYMRGIYDTHALDTAAWTSQSRAVWFCPIYDLYIYNHKSGTHNLTSEAHDLWTGPDATDKTASTRGGWEHRERASLKGLLGALEGTGLTEQPPSPGHPPPLSFLKSTYPHFARAVCS